MQRSASACLPRFCVLCAGVRRALQGPADLPRTPMRWCCSMCEARGQDVVATVSAAAFAADGTSYTYSKEIPYAFALATAHRDPARRGRDDAGL